MTVGGCRGTTECISSVSPKCTFRSTCNHCSPTGPDARSPACRLFPVSLSFFWFLRSLEKSFYCSLLHVRVFHRCGKWDKLVRDETLSPFLLFPHTRRVICRTRRRFSEGVFRLRFPEDTPVFPSLFFTLFISPYRIVVCPKVGLRGWLTDAIQVKPNKWRYLVFHYEDETEICARGIRFSAENDVDKHWMVLAALQLHVFIETEEFRAPIQLLSTFMFE